MDFDIYADADAFSLSPDARRLLHSFIFLHAAPAFF